MAFKNILCVSDLSFISKNAAYAAVRLAYKFNAKLTILSCGEQYCHKPNNYFDENIIQPTNDSLYNSEYNEYLQQKKQETIDFFSEIQNTLQMQLKNNLFFEIKLENEVTATLDLLEEKKPPYDLIIAGKQNTSHWERLLFGSPAKEICDQTKVSTLLIPSSEEWISWEPRGILICTTLDNIKEEAELVGAKIAQAYSINLTLMHVLNTSSEHITPSFAHIFPIDYIPPQNSIHLEEDFALKAQKDLEQAIKNLQQSTGIKNIQGRIEYGEVGESIINYLNLDPKNNLLIIGSKGENTLKRFFLGSNTDAIEEACLTPILIFFPKNC